MTNNPHVYRSTLTNKSIDFDLNLQPSNSIVLEQKQIQLDTNNSITTESNHEQKSAYKIPSPTILLRSELSSSSKLITSSSSSHMVINKISRSTPLESHRNFLLNTEIRQSSLIRTPFTQSYYSEILVSQMTNEILSSSVLPLSPDLKLLRDNETIPHVSSFEISPQIKPLPEIKHESESLWKTKFTLKTLLSIANRDEAQALKNRKPIDYHMFLSNKWKKNSILQYHDYMERKFTVNNQRSIIEQVNEEETTRKLYKRLLNTMSIGKPKKIESIILIKSRKTKRKTRIKPSDIIREDSLPSLTDDQSEKPLLITYEAKLI